MFEFQLSKVTSLKNDLLSGLTVALALVPEAVACAFVAGVAPLVSLYAAVMVGLITGSSDSLGFDMLLGARRDAKLR